jgi:pimeloyl-ACP methyl ester carboxylesterase
VAAVYDHLEIASAPIVGHSLGGVSNLHTSVVFLLKLGSNRFSHQLIVNTFAAKYPTRVEKIGMQFYVPRVP